MKLKNTLISLALCLFASASLAADPLGDEAKKAGRPLIVDFGMNMCKQCIKQSEAMEEYKKAVGGKIDTRFVHVTKEAETAGAYKVMLIPTLLFFDKSGKELFRQVGYMASGDMLAKSRELGLLPK